MHTKIWQDLRKVVGLDINRLSEPLVTREFGDRRALLRVRAEGPTQQMTQFYIVGIFLFINQRHRG